MNEYLTMEDIDDILNLDTNEPYKKLNNAIALTEYYRDLLKKLKVEATLGELEDDEGHVKLNIRTAKELITHLNRLEGYLKNEQKANRVYEETKAEE